MDRAVDYRGSHQGRPAASFRQMGVDSLTPATVRRPGEHRARARRHGGLPPDRAAARSPPAAATARSSRRPPSTAAASRSCAPPARVRSGPCTSAIAEPLSPPLMVFATLDLAARILVVVALVYASAVALTHWAVRSRRITPFGALAPVHAARQRPGAAAARAPRHPRWRQPAGCPALAAWASSSSAGLLLLSLVHWLTGFAAHARGDWPTRGRASGPVSS